MSLAYFSFYPKDFVSAVPHLSREQIGAYTLMLCFLWEYKKASEEDLVMVGFGYDADSNKTKKVIDLFELEDGFLFSKRLEKERFICEEKHRINVEKGKKGGRPKSNGEKPQLNPNLSTTKAEPKPNLSNHNHNHIIINDKEDTHIPACEKLDFTDREVVRTESTQIPTKETAKAWADYHFQKLDFDVWFKHWDSLGWRDSNGRPVKWQQKMAYNAKERMFIKATTTAQKQQIKQVGYDPDQGRETLMNWYDKMKLQEV